MSAPATPLATLADRPANQLARKITGRPYISHNQISTMRACPRKWAFHYIEAAPVDHLPSSLLFGGGIHSAVELAFRSQLEGLAVTPESLLDAYRDHWHEERLAAGKDVPVRFSKGEDEMGLVQMARRVIAAFLVSPVSHPSGVILGIEEELKVTLSPELPDVLTKVDLVTQGQNALNVVDFKTSRSRWTPDRAETSADQLLLYVRAVQGMSAGLKLPVSLKFVILTKAKTPLVQVLEVAADQQRFEAAQAAVAQVWQAIQAGNFFPNPSPINCAACPFKSRCPVFATSPAPNP